MLVGVRARKRQCAHQGDDGQPCGATPQRDLPFCFWHDPERREEAQEARRLGGLRRKRETALSGAYDFEGLDDVPSIRRLLQIAALDSLALDNGVARNRTIIAAAAAAAKLLEVGELEARVEALEAAVQPHDAPQPVFDVEPVG